MNGKIKRFFGIGTPNDPPLVNSKPKESERGAIIIITALLIVALLLLVARAIDLSIGESSKTKSQGITSGASLAALERYFQSTNVQFLNPPCSTLPAGYLCQITQARNRAQTLINNAYNDILGETNIGGPQPPSVHLVLPHETITGCGGGIPLHKCVDGIVRPGQWYFAEPEETCGVYSGPNWSPDPGVIPACPCDGNIWKGACFRQVSTTDGSEKANAFQVQYWGSYQRPMQTYFARVAGPEANSLSINSKSTASIVPKQAILAIDTSASTQQDNFETSYDADAIAPHRGHHNTAKVSFQLDRTVPGNKCSDLGTNNPCPTIGVCTFYPGASQNNIYNEDECLVLDAFIAPCLPSNRATPPTPPFSTPLLPDEHAKDDYDCASIAYQVCPACNYANGVEDCNLPACGALGTDDYVVDTYTNVSYHGAEPLNSIIDAVFETTKIFEQRGVSNDLMGAFFFDSTANVVASDHPNPATLLRRYPLTTIGSPIFNELKEATDDTTGFPQNRIDHLLFPRREHNGSGVYTNFPEIITQAYNQLSSAIGAETADQFVILISDGMTNCDPDLNPTCANQRNWVVESISETGLRLAPYGAARIAFHYVTFGNATGPHNIIRRTIKPGSTSCMDEFEARNEGLAWVDPGTGSQVDFNATFVDYPPTSEHWSWPLNFQSWSDYTNGFYLPVREQCQDGTDVSAYVSGICAGLGAGQAYSGPPINPGGWTYPGTAIGGAGQLYCEPTNRTKKVIMSDMIKEIFNRNPYLLISNPKVPE